MTPDAWTIRIHRNALQALYRLPRGEAAAASDLIAALQTEPIPDGAQPREPGSRVYRYAGAGYQLIFEIDDLERIIRVLGIRQIGEGEEG